MAAIDPISAIHHPVPFSRKPTYFCLSLPASGLVKRRRPLIKPQMHRMLDGFDESLDQIGCVLNERLGEDIDLVAFLIEAIPVDAVVA